MSVADVLKNFNAAIDYDRHAEIQQRVALDLLAFTPDGAQSILELGCGSGGYTNLLCDAFPNATVTALDAAWRMVRTCQQNVASPNVRFICADAETYNVGRFDLVTGNAVLHWFEDLPSGIRRLREQISPGGTLTFSHFGPETYRELRAALSAALGYEVTLAANAFASPDILAELLFHCYSDVQLETRTYTDEFISLRELLNNIKATGTRGHGASPRVAWTPGLLRRVEERYRAECNTIRATYQVTLCRCVP